jgi:hypothetical protein
MSPSDWIEILPPLFRFEQTLYLVQIFLLSYRDPIMILSSVKLFMIPSHRYSPCLLLCQLLPLLARL